MTEESTRNASRDRIKRHIGNSFAPPAHRFHRCLPDSTGPIPRLPCARPLRRCSSHTASSGTIRAIGVSNFSVAQMEEFRSAAPSACVAARPIICSSAASRRKSCHIAIEHGIALTFGYGALCRGLLSGRMRADTRFEGDDLRLKDPKFQQPRFSQYLAAVGATRPLRAAALRQALSSTLRVAWVLDQGVTTALWGARHPRAARSGSGGRRLVAGCVGEDRDRPHHRGYRHRSRRPGIHGAAGIRLGLSGSALHSPQKSPNYPAAQSL